MGEAGVNPALSRNREKIFSSRITHKFLSTRRGLRGMDSHLVSFNACVSLLTKGAPCLAMYLLRQESFSLPLSL